jgi:ubiquinone/menaquinone biosynthesis C-methylase UbiE
VLDLEEIREYYERILPYYEREAASRGDLVFWQNLARAWRPRLILEIGCGTGRISLALAKTAPTIGIDISFDLLRRARRKSGAPRASFVAADFRETVFSRRFDLIVAPSDPLSHLTAVADRRRALRSVARQLAPGGRFVLDALVRRGKAPVVSERFLRDRQGSLQICEVWSPTARPGLWRATYSYSERQPGGRIAGTEASFLARVWEPRAIRSFFSSCGLAVVNLWGTLSHRDFSAASPRLIVVARPAGSFSDGA